jgi:NAD+ synthase
VHNAAFLLDGGRVIARRAKHELPRGDPFDPGPAPGPVVFRDIRLGLMIGEDAHFPAVAETLAESGAEILLSIGASPFAPGEPERRIDRAVARVVETGLPLAFLGQVGGQGDLVFDGGGFVLNADRALALRQPQFGEAVTATDWHRTDDGWACAPLPLPRLPPAPEQQWRALMLGLADAVDRNGCPGVVLELSGDAGSALSAACAVDALGAARVRAVALPSPETPAGRLEDAAACAALLGIRLDRLPIAPALAGFQTMLGGVPDPAARDLCGRIRAAVLQAQAHASGEMLLASRDRSDIALGQGGQPGGYSVLKGLWKTTALELARWRDAHRPDGALGPAGPIMPPRLFLPAPGRDGLPPQDILDPILQGLVEEGLDPEMMAARGFDRDTVTQVWRWLDRAGYKRRQEPPAPCPATRPSGGSAATPFPTD